MDVRDKIARTDKDEHTYQQRGSVYERNQGEIQFHRCRADIIDRRVESDEARVCLQQYETDGYDVSPKHAVAYDEDSEPQECPAHASVACAKCFKNTNHACAFENNDEQPRGHRKAGNAHHQRQNNPDIDVEQFEPGEYLRIGFVYCHRRECLSISVCCPVNPVRDVHCGFVQTAEILHQKLRSAALSLVPSVQPDCRIQIREAQVAVKLRHVGLINAADGELPCPHPVVGDEVGEDAVARLQFQLVRHDARDEQPVAALAVAELWYFAFLKIFPDERHIIFRTDALENDTEEIGVCLEYALRGDKPLYVPDAVDAVEHSHRAISDIDRCGVRTLHRQQVLNLDVASETDDLVPYRMLEPQHDSHRDNHHRQSRCDADCGDAYCRAADLAAVTVFPVYPFR